MFNISIRTLLCCDDV